MKKIRAFVWIVTHSSEATNSIRLMHHNANNARVDIFSLFRKNSLTASFRYLKFSITQPKRAGVSYYTTRFNVSKTPTIFVQIAIHKNLTANKTGKHKIINFARASFLRLGHFPMFVCHCQAPSKVDINVAQGKKPARLTTPSNSSCEKTHSQLQSKIDSLQNRKFQQAVRLPRQSFL